jgi:hypothetical protein
MSPLVDDQLAGREDVAIALQERKVQRAAGDLSASIDDLRSLMGVHSAAAIGVYAALAESDGGLISADAVAQWLRVFTQQIEEQIAYAKDHLAQHDAAVKRVFSGTCHSARR